MKNSKFHLVLFFIFIFIAAGLGMSQSAGEFSFDVKKISERVIVVQVEGDENVLAINSRKGIVVIDTTISPVFAALVRDRISEEFGSENFAYVINTHFHGDHTYGNQVFSEALFIGHEKCGEGMRNDESRRISAHTQYTAGIEQLKKSLEKMEENSDPAKTLAKRIAFYQAIVDGIGEKFGLTLPDITFSDRLSLDLEDLTLNLYAYGTSHTDSDILIHCPEEGLWMTGDLFAAGYEMRK